MPQFKVPVFTEKTETRRGYILVNAVDDEDAEEQVYSGIEAGDLGPENPNIVWEPEPEFDVEPLDIDVGQNTEPA